MGRVICRGCGRKEKIGADAPRGSKPDDWVSASGSVYCKDCALDLPTLQMSVRMSGGATAAVIEAVSSDPGLRAAMEEARSTARIGSPEFLRLVRASVEGACSNGAESLPAPIRALLNDVLACVQWDRVAAHVGRAGISAPIAPPQEENGTDPFAI